MPSDSTAGNRGSCARCLGLAVSCIMRSEDCQPTNRRRKRAPARKSGDLAPGRSASASSVSQSHDLPMPQPWSRDFTVGESSTPDSSSYLPASGDSFEWSKSGNSMTSSSPDVAKALLDAAGLYLAGPSAYLMSGGSPRESLPTFVPPLVRQPDLAVPLAPAQNRLPDPNTIHLYVDAYFSYMDLTIPMLNRRTFHTSVPSTLLLCSILVLVPLFRHSSLRNNWTQPDVAKWKISLLQRAKEEMFAFLGSGQPATAEVVAAVMNLVLFCMIAGQNALSARLVLLAKKLVASMGLVSDYSTMEPPLGLLTWKDVLLAAHGADVATRPLSPAERDQILNLWIEYWSRERVTQILIYIQWSYMLVVFFWA